MKSINIKYILVEKIEEEKGDGIQMVEIQDEFIYKAKVKLVPEIPVFVGNTQVEIGNTVIFAKYSPDTHEYQKTEKFVRVDDVLAIL